MLTYLELMKNVLAYGDERIDRTGVGTLSTFGKQLKFDLKKGFPLLTTKKMFWKGIVEELLWFIRGDTNIRSLQEKGVHIWDEWADENGDLGPVYGAQWHNEGQFYSVIREIKENPQSRRLLVCSWNVQQLKQMALPPCHVLFQFYVNDGKLSLQVYQRSADIFLGLPFNIASYALLCDLVARETNLVPSELIWTGGDCHIYKNHVEQVKQQLERIPRQLPTLSYPVKELFKNEYTFEDFKLHGYNPHPAIKADIAV